MNFIFLFCCDLFRFGRALSFLFLSLKIYQKTYYVYLNHDYKKDVSNVRRTTHFSFKKHAQTIRTRLTCHRFSNLRS